MLDRERSPGPLRGCFAGKRMPLLQRANLTGSAAERDNRVTRRRCRRKSRRVGNLVLECRSSDGVVVLLSQLTQGGVDEELYLAREEEVDSIRSSLVDLQH